jgi:hypothetical protein
MDHTRSLRMYIVLCVSFAVCICPGICDIPSQTTVPVSIGPVGVSVTPQLSVTTGGGGNTIFA